MKGAVAAGHRLTAGAAAEILRAGGNAFDAAVGGFFAACVAEPALASLGGGGYLLARERGGRTSVFDFFTHTPGAGPRSRDLDFYPVTVDFGAARQVFHIGLGACAAPGAVRGMFAVHRDLGKLPMNELVRPAVELARDGVAVNRFQSYLLELLAPIFRTASALPLYAGAAPDKLLQPGDVFHNPPLADALQALAAEGDALFYEGDLGKRIVRACNDGGGYLTRDDLKNYRAYRRAPLLADYRGRRLATNPAPAAGGLLVAFGLEFLKTVELGKRGFEFGGIAAVKALSDAQLATCRLRDGGDGDGNFGDDGELSNAMRDPQRMQQYREQYRRVQTRTHARRGTTHISVIDAARNIASLSVSNGEGCGRVVDGFMLNNMLGEEDVNPRGFHRWRPNRRMASMMAPSVIADRGALTALGSGGSNRIRSALLQVISNLADFRMDAPAAVAAPRLHVEGSQLRMEAGFPAATINAAARELGDHHNLGDHRVFNEPHMFFGGVHLAQVTRHGKLSAIGDPRRDGAGVVV